MDERFMQMALTLGQRGLGNVWPNPAVGCVLVKDNRVIARGWTQPGGRPHAEVHALMQAGEQARNATAYVTLEPCAHHGKTGPCSDALVKAGIRRVVCATQDPDARVCGKGFEILEKAGIEVTRNVLKAQADADHIGFFSRITKSRPSVTLKLASSLDGRIATRTGDSRWITGPMARRAVHLMRARHDAILVGRNTVAQDDPDLSVRDLGLAHRSPVRVVLDSRLSLPATGRLARTARDIPLWICHTNAADSAQKWSDIGAFPLTCAATAGGQLDISGVLEALANQGITRLFVEGGGQVAASFLQAGVVDELALFSAGVAIGADGRPNLGAFGVDALKDAPRFTRKSVTTLGPDILSIWSPEKT
ncbi:bifunctional diaminohydroxyphosphoribosylaminopyrimidine deaminase/5-amino-6-(5-phosphoribosylamino)uracil reductase RibD [Amylibacter cionae]|uniref:bifunctional diaminohydroxyphosphoribosylaminopyrimidine deaminase/5-amino-6-(5-phosphoribosylamino)uracil reductase RibD n=1 Tax=Neptunicoccus cionae TaxID=2035344 RepID=UPI000C76601E|nr:bifunctional diaminohydroxyphosphoribosylaminopyrimidine deaminase/5-amino-6-(5-phosphoribosylamino)uracil reductase RibD [Amylibacter cionae]PLS22559.1 bifunctional diaminohydroxyphosphoribosylaminopyrimidine deaminase/5-amino-6-(5-phosphoribosylamino)uracil reductase RibD [Amylibacter cionae]